ncbi:hypothetical protein HDU97_000313 [Phlyctochytrium planicorne]|nr:hypothetical protein HDU97_000313 [Phlyctochytrium planicorne]
MSMSTVTAFTFTLFASIVTSSPIAIHLLRKEELPPQPCASCNTPLPSTNSYIDIHNHVRNLYNLPLFTVSTTLESAAVQSLENMQTTDRFCDDNIVDSMDRGQGESRFGISTFDQARRDGITFTDVMKSFLSADDAYFLWSENNANPSQAFDLASIYGVDMESFTRLINPDYNQVGCSVSTSASLVSSRTEYYYMVACRYGRDVDPVDPDHDGKPKNHGPKNSPGGGGGSGGGDEGDDGDDGEGKGHGHSKPIKGKGEGDVDEKTPVDDRTPVAIDDGGGDTIELPPQDEPNPVPVETF